mmetsp:Transcript_13541/g.26863  ORF Transcript_13541/g.26863 Transcript_13541/m.26863 type:complete len:206 (+) Transcript_13541:740-1357(+)
MPPLQLDLCVALPLPPPEAGGGCPVHVMSRLLHRVRVGGHSGVGRVVDVNVAVVAEVGMGVGVHCQRGGGRRHRHGVHNGACRGVDCSGGCSCEAVLKGGPGNDCRGPFLLLGGRVCGLWSCGASCLGLLLGRDGAAGLADCALDLVKEILVLFQETAHGALLLLSGKEGALRTGFFRLLGQCLDVSALNGLERVPLLLVLFLQG